MMSNKIVELPLDSIISDPNQPRKSFDETKIQELAESVTQHGLLQPILVRPLGNGKFQIVHGERRWRACKLIGLKTIKAEVRELDDKEVLEIQLVENLQRENLNPIEEAEAFNRMVEELGYTHEAIAKRVGKSREYVTNKLRLLKLPDDIKNALREGKITESHAKALISLKNNEQTEIFEKVVAEGLSIREMEEIIKGNNVPRGTMSDIPSDGLIIGVWVSQQTHQKLRELAMSENTTVEQLCSNIIKEAMENCPLK